jgi:hypothetical protein
MVNLHFRICGLFFFFSSNFYHRRCQRPESRAAQRGPGTALFTSLGSHKAGTQTQIPWVPSYTLSHVPVLSCWDSGLSSRARLASSTLSNSGDPICFWLSLLSWTQLLSDTARAYTVSTPSGPGQVAGFGLWPRAGGGEDKPLCAAAAVPVVQSRWLEAREPPWGGGQGRGRGHSVSPTSFPHLRQGLLTLQTGQICEDPCRLSLISWSEDRRGHQGLCYILSTALTSIRSAGVVLPHFTH